MTVPFELYVATRYLLARRRQAFIALISLVSTAGVAVGVMALVVALALMTGMQQDIRDKLIGAQAHVYVYQVIGDGFPDYREEAARLTEVPGVLGAAPSLLGRAVATSSGIEKFLSLKGVDPELERQVTALDEAMRHGSLAALSKTHDGVVGGVILGEDLAVELGAFVGDRISVMTMQGATLSPLGPVPRPRPLEVVGIFNLGLYEYDHAYGFVSLDTAQRLFRQDSIDMMQLKVEDLDDAADIAAQIESTFGAGYVAQDWSELNQALYSALELEKMGIGITIALIMIVAALNIVASLSLLVMEKSRDIAILKTMGATSRTVRRIFVLQGGIIGAVGTLAGAVGGVVISYVADRYQLVQIPMDVYDIAWVPFRVELLDFVLVVTAAVLVCLVATIYPSRQASRLDPAEALRYQ